MIEQLFKHPPNSVWMNVLTAWCDACALETSGWCGGCETCLMYAAPKEHICGIGDRCKYPR